jgi:hypothetical protein
VNIEIAGAVQYMIASTEPKSVRETLGTNSRGRGDIGVVSFGLDSEDLSWGSDEARERLASECLGTDRLVGGKVFFST